MTGKVFNGEGVPAPGVTITVVDHPDAFLLPGFVDTHVHFPQLRVIGALGMPLLDWLDRAALPEELRMADDDQAAAVAILQGWLDARR